MSDFTVRGDGTGNYTELDEALDNVSGTSTVTMDQSWSGYSDTRAAIVSSSNVTITATGDARFNGVWDVDSYHLSVNTGTTHALTINSGVTGTVIDGIIIDQAGTGNSAECVRVATSDDVTITDSLLVCTTNTNYQDCLYLQSGANCEIYVTNSAFIGAGRGGLHAQANSGASTRAIEVNSCLFYKNGRNSTGTGGGIIADDYTDEAGSCGVHNSVFLENDDGSTGSDWADVWDEGPEWTWTCDYSVCSDQSISGSEPTLQEDKRGGSSAGSEEQWTIVTSVSATTKEYGVTNLTIGQGLDLNLIDSANNNAKGMHAVSTGAGSSLTIPTTDMAGNTRDTTTPLYDLGPMAVTLAGGDDSVSINGVALTVTGQSVSVQDSINLVTASLGLTGLSLGAIAVGLEIGNVALGITGQSLDVLAADVINVTGASLSITPQSVFSDDSIDLTTASLTFTPQDLGLAQGLSIGTASLAITGQPLTVQGLVTVNISTASLGITGQGLSVQDSINVGTASLTLTGQQLAAIVQQVHMTAASLGITGQTLGVNNHVNVDIGTVGMTIGGQPLTVSAQGQVSITGTSIDLTGLSLTIDADEDVLWRLVDDKTLVRVLEKSLTDAFHLL